MLWRKVNNNHRKVDFVLLKITPLFFLNEIKFKAQKIIAVIYTNIRWAKCYVHSFHGYFFILNYSEQRLIAYICFISALLSLPKCAHAIPIILSTVQTNILIRSNTIGMLFFKDVTVKFTPPFITIKSWIEIIKSLIIGFAISMNGRN